MNTFEKVAHQKKYLEDLGYNVLYIGLFGSQNYGLDDEDSDIDLRAIVLPTLEQYIRRERISVRLETDMGIIDVKDPVTFHNVIVKGNFAYLEVVHTKYYIGDTFFRYLFKDIQLNLRSLKGDMYGKAKILCPPGKGARPPGEVYGNKPKEVYQLFRMYYLINENEKMESFIDYSDDIGTKNLLMDIKNPRDWDTLGYINSVVNLSSYILIKKWIEKVTKEKVPTNYEYEMDDLLSDLVPYIKSQILKLNE